MQRVDLWSLTGENVRLYKDLNFVNLEIFKQTLCSCQCPSHSPLNSKNLCEMSCNKDKIYFLL